MENRNVLTTNQGAPVADNQNSKTAGQRGPTLLEDYHLIEKLAHFDRERIPERVVHARGGGSARRVCDDGQHGEIHPGRLFAGSRHGNAGVRPLLHGDSRRHVAGDA